MNHLGGPVRRVSWIVIGVVCGVCALILGCQRALLFPGGGVAPLEPLAVRVAGAIALDVPHDDGRSEGLLLPALGATGPTPVVIFAHGNGELIDGWIAALRPYRQRGLAVALLEYRGYGRSGGSASQKALVADFVRFVDALAQRPEIDATRIVYHGRSLGGGVVAGVAALRPPRALIIESSFASVADLAWESWWIPRLFVRDPFDSHAALATYTGPSLILHGRGDRLIPFSHAERLAARPGARLVPRDCGHNDCPRDAVYWQAIAELLAEAGVR